jgi:UDP-N-acetyl-D-glucosamine dehydrogenase
MKKTRHFDHGMTSVELTPERLAEQDAVLVLTDHDAYDWSFICKHARLVVDTRNATKKIANRDNIRKL